MNATMRSGSWHKHALGLVGMMLLTLALWGCHKAPAAADHMEGASHATGEAASKGEGNSSTPETEGSEEGVTLTPDEIEKLGLTTSAARAITHSPEVSGFAVVLAHETIAAAVAELHTAIAAAHQSQLALERSRRLAGTPGAMPADTQETAERQALADRAALELARQRLSSAFGQKPPWKDAQNSSELQSLASGRSKLVRLTFPLGSLGNTTPTHVRLARIDTAQGPATWQSQSVWRAPADTSVPGQSFFAILKDSEASEGDHLLAWTPVGEPESGVLIPASAVVMSAGKFWCYVEKKPHIFVRKEVDSNRPTADGYFVKEDVSAGDPIVTTAAGQLLAREMNPSKEAE